MAAPVSFSRLLGVLLPSPAAISSLPPLESSSPSNLADNQEVVLRPAVRLQVRLARLVVVSVLRVAGGPAALLPRRKRSPLTALQAKPVEVPLGDLAALFRVDVPIERERVP